MWFCSDSEASPEEVVSWLWTCLEQSRPAPFSCSPLNRHFPSHHTMCPHPIVLSRLNAPKSLVFYHDVQRASLGESMGLDGTGGAPRAQSRLASRRGHFLTSLPWCPALFILAPALARLCLQSTSAVHSSGHLGNIGSSCVVWLAP